MDKMTVFGGTVVVKCEDGHIEIGSDIIIRPGDTPSCSSKVKGGRLNDKM